MSAPPSAPRRALDRALTFSLRHPALGLGLVVVVTAALALELPRLRRDVRVEKIFPDSDPALVVYRRFLDAFGADNRLAICALELDGDVLAAEQLARLHGWAAELAREPLVDPARIASLASAPVLRQDGPDGLELAPLYEPRRRAGWDAEAAWALVRDHPGFRDRLLSADRRVATLLVPIRPEHDHVAGRRAFVDRLRAFFAARLEPGERAHLDGLVVSEIELHTLVGADTARFFPLALAVLVLVLGITFRRASLVLISAADVLLSVVWTLGLMAVTDIPMSFLSAAIPVMIIVSCVGDSVYLTTRYHQLLGAGLERRAALEAAIASAGLACLLTSVTTSIGFLALLTSEAEVIRELAIPVGAGVLASYAVTFLLVPPLLDRLPAAPAARAAAGPAALRRPLAWLAARILARPRSILAGAAALALIALAFAPSTPVRSRMLEDLHPDEPLMQSRALLERRMGGVVPLELVVDAGGAGGALDPDLQRGLFGLAQALRGERFRALGVLHALSSADLLADLHHGWQGRSEGARAIPAAREQVAGLVLAYEMAESDPTAAYLDFERRRARLAMRIENLYTADLARLVEAVEREAAHHLPAGARVEVTGRALMAQAIHRSLVKSVGQSLAIAVAAVGLILLAALRSPRLAVLGLVPNLLPLLLVAGVMGAFGLALNIATSIIFTVAFGIAVDDTIHFLAGLAERRRDRALGEALEATLCETGAAMVLTTAVLALGFLVLCASRFQVNRSIGALLSLTLGFALLADLALLPALLRVLLPDDARGQGAHSEGAAEAPAAFTAPGEEPGPPRRGSPG